MFGCCIGDTGWGGSYFSEHHINLIVNAGMTGVRLFVDIDSWKAKTETNPMRLPYPDYIKACIDMLENRGVHVMMSCHKAWSEGEYGIRLINDISIQNDWISFLKDLVTKVEGNVTALDPIDEPVATQGFRDGLVSDVQWRAFMTKIIEECREIDPNIAMCVFGVPYHYLQMYWNYSTNLLGHVLRGDGVLPYPNIVYMLNRPPFYEGSSNWGHGTENPTEEERTAMRAGMASYLDGKIGTLKGFQKTIHLTSAVHHYPYTTPLPRNWQLYMKDVYDYAWENGYWFNQWGLTWNKWNLLTQNYENWNESGSFLASQTQPSICVVDEDCRLGFTCVEGKSQIITGCRTNADCKAGEVCVDGVCVPVGTKYRGAMIATAAGVQQKYLDQIDMWTDLNVPRPLHEAYHMVAPPFARYVENHNYPKKPIKEVVEWLMSRQKRNSPS